MSDDSTLSSRRVRFEVLVLPHLDAAFNLARWLARDDQDAEDIVQDAFLRAFDALDGLRGENARPWLLAIVRNTTFSWLAQRRNGATQVSYDEELHAVADLDSDPARLALCADDRRQVDEALARVPPPFREVIVLRELEDMSYREIAAVLGIPVGTVMSRLARGRKMLADELRRAGNGE
jgi:RNA polymerase sigma-70 factor (ECF subfamily)